MIASAWKLLPNVSENSLRHNILIHVIQRRTESKVIIQGQEPESLARVLTLTDTR